MKFQWRLVALICGIIIFLYFSISSLINKTRSIKSNYKSPIKKESHKICIPLKHQKGDLDTFDLLTNASRISFFNHRKGKDEEQMPDLSDIPVKTKPMTVFVVPHSHNDPAWIQTLDGYWEAQTSYILKNILTYLNKYKNMTFVWTETILLDRWWKELSVAEKQNVSKLVESGRLEIAGGGWVAPDEATTTVFGLVDNLIQGHSWLQTNLPVAQPNTWWNLDPFGYSSVAAYLVKQAGYSQSAILRINDFIKNNLRKSSNIEFKWIPFWKDSEEQGIFTSVFPFLMYNIKYSCGPHPYTCLKFDFRQVPGDNSESRAEPVTPDNVQYLSEILYQQLKLKSRVYKHNVVMYPLGDDFRYDQPVEWEQQYVNFQKLFSYMNSQPKWNVKINFGTPQNYFDAIRKEANDYSLQFPSLSGDFFTYIDKDYSFWSGYFTTRPYWKRMSRDLQHNLRAAEIFYSIFRILDPLAMKKSKFQTEDLISNARYISSFFQHHDSITGTSLSHVAEDYLEKLASAIKSSQLALAYSLKTLLSLPGNFVFTLTRSKSAPFAPTDLALPNNAYNTIYLINSVSQKHMDCIRFHVSKKFVKAGIINQDGDISQLSCQINPNFRNSRISSSVFEVITCLELPSMGVQAIVIDTGSGKSKNLKDCSIAEIHYSDSYRVAGWKVNLLSKTPIKLSGKDIDAEFSSKTGMLTSMKNKKLSIEENTKVNIALYSSQGSGTYIFHSTDENPLYNFYPRASILVVQGPIMSSIRVGQSAYNQTTTVYNVNGHLANVIHMRTEVDLYNPRMDYSNTELFMSVSSNIRSGNIFHTDSNSFVLVKRKRLPTLPLSGNYYPITNGIMISDGKTRLSLLTSHAHGATSRNSGQLEVILQRHAPNDDSRGNPEGLGQDYRTVSDIFLLLEREHQTFNSHANEGASPSITATLSSRFLNYPPIPVLYQAASTERITAGRVSWIMGTEISCDIELVNLRSDFNSSSILAVIHRHGVDCRVDHSLTVCPNSSYGKGVTLRDLLPHDSQFRSIISTALSGRLHGTKSSSLSPNSDLDLSSNEIKTFKIIL